MSQLHSICIDCADPWKLAHWWAPIIGYRVRPHSESDLEELRANGFAGPEEDPNIATDPVDGSGPMIWFNRVPEPKQTKNRIHLDVYADAEALVAAGATVVDRQPKWTVLADPEGNEFCAFPPPRG